MLTVDKGNAQSLEGGTLVVEIGGPTLVVNVSIFLKLMPTNLSKGGIFVLSPVG
jgi:hypothetical protein